MLEEREPGEERDTPGPDRDLDMESPGAAKERPR